ncbi:MAG: stage III sporulation protein AD [Clostridiales bacterium]|jgi:stage III sporulation protein AD|nr:stage III sporulation protein AD [Clostridiales bacterium]
METEIYKIAAAGIIATILALTLKRDNPVFGVFVGIAISVIILLALMPALTEVFGIFKEISSLAGANTDYILIIVKIIAISYIAEFAAQICSDAGEAGIGAKIEFGGKVIIMTVAAPLIVSLIKEITGMLP